MDALYTVDYARLRLHTRATIKGLKNRCEIALEDLELGLEYKKKAVQEKIDSASLYLRAFPGHVTNTLDLYKHLLTDFSTTVMDNISPTC